MTENLPRGSFARGGEGVPGILIFRIIIIIIIFLFLYPHYANLNRILCALRQSTANEAAVQLQRRPAQERARNGIQNPVNGAPTLFRIIIIIIIFSFSLSTLCQLEFDQQLWVEPIGPGGKKKSRWPTLLKQRSGPGHQPRPRSRVQAMPTREDGAAAS